MISKLVPIFIFGWAAICLADDLTLTISDGQVKGAEKTTFRGNKYYAFQSIPYGQPPISFLRFQAPVPVKPWSGVFDGTKEGNICYQVNRESPDESEDCLSLSVHTPKKPSEVTKKLPVVIYIHGGWYDFGSGQTRKATGTIDPGYFMDTGSVIFVAMNYRLGPFGFLFSGDSYMPGNAGLKDQLLALKWVQKNIATFGGDPKRVTLFGNASGAAAVALLILSRAASGLFSAALLTSGTTLSPWAYQRNQAEITFKTASYIFSTFEKDRNTQKLWYYLQYANAEDIDSASKKYTDWALSNTTGINDVVNAQLQQGYFYTPVIEPDNDSPLVTEKFYQALENGHFEKVPILFGTCADEGLTNYPNIKRLLSVYDDDHSLLVPPSLHITDQETKKAVGDAIKQQYSPNSRLQDNVLAGINYFTDNDFQRSIIRHAELHSKYSDVYFFKFSYSGTMGENTQYRYPGTSNSTHGELANYIWQRKSASDYPQADQTVHERLLKIYTNFIINHNPTPSKDATLQNIIWPKFKEGELRYVDIGANLTIKTNPNARLKFWTNLFEKYGVKPFDTY